MNTERAARLLQGEGNFYGTLNPSVTLRVTGPGCGTQHPLRVVNNTCVLLAAAPTATPVSYAHLDVYKRQAGKFYPNMPTLPTPVVFILVIAICAIVGLCNGLVVSYLKVQPFIATLGMQQVVYGICLVYTGGTPIGSLNKNFTSLASDTILGIPLLIIIALIVAACFWFLYNKTRHGKYMYAIGGNEAAAEVAGVNVYATKIRIYILASCMFGLAGCLLAAKSGGASVNTAQGYELDAIAASTIGGVSTTGGVGTVPGILVGVLVFELMKVALQFMNVNSSYTYIVQGLVIIVAVAIDIRKYLAKK